MAQEYRGPHNTVVKMNMAGNKRRVIMSTAHAVQPLTIPSGAILGRSFILGMPDRKGNYRVGLECSVWKIPEGGYATGDRVKIVAIDNDMLSVEKVGV